MPPSEPIVELNGVGLSFAGPPRVDVLYPMDLRIMNSSTTAIVGPSGAGKSSLASVIGWLQPASVGTYLFAGRDVTNLSQRAAARLRAREIGFVFQSPHLIDERTAWVNVALGVADHSMSNSDLEERCRAMLREVGLAGVADRQAGLLSGGERQRVAVARALLKGPKLIVADEPTASLDQRNGQAVLDLLFELSERESTLLLVTHDPRAATLVDTVVTLVDGRIVR